LSANQVSFDGSIPENYDRYLGPILFDPYAVDLTSRLDLPEAATVLELACGTGIVTRRLRDRLGAAAKLVATDINPAMLDYAKAKLGPDQSVEWKQVDATELPFPDQSLDAIVTLSCEATNEPRSHTKWHQSLSRQNLLEGGIDQIMKHPVHLFGRIRHASIKPPLQQSK
jgi:SAM-dependent methyltransferase